jgi:hypothetical protein
MDIGSKEKDWCRGAQLLSGSRKMTWMLDDDRQLNKLRAALLNASEGVF